MSIAFVQSTQGTTGGSQTTSLAKAYTSSNTPGNFLICAIRAYYGANGVPTIGVTDTLGNTWTEAPGSFNNAAVARYSVWYVQNCASGSNTVTVTTTTSSFIRIAIAEYSGLTSTVSVDAQHSATGTSTSADSGSMVTTNANDLLIGWGGNDTNSALLTTVTGSWTQREQVDGSPFSDQIVSSTGSYNYTFTIASSVNWAADVMSFKPTISSGNQPVIIIMQ